MATNYTACGIDVGSTNIKFYSKINGQEYKFHMPYNRTTFTRRNLIDSIAQFMKTLPQKVDTLGIAYSGNGTPFLIKNTGINCIQRVTANDFKELGCKTIFINDANATAIAGTMEYPNAKVLVSITNGTGIGAGICMNGLLFTGSNFCAGEVHGNLIGSYHHPQKVGSIGGGKALLDFINSTDNPKIQQQKIKEFAKIFSILLTQIVNLLNPDIVYLAGGIFQYDNYFDLVKETTLSFIASPIAENLKIVLAQDYIYSGCIGAIKYAIDNL